MIGRVGGRAVGVIPHVAHVAGGEGDHVPGGGFGVLARSGAVEDGHPIHPIRGDLGFGVVVSAPVGIVVPDHDLVRRIKRSQV